VKVNLANVMINQSESGKPEAWVHGGRGTVVQMYRFFRGRWEERSGFGEPWKRCDVPPLAQKHLDALQKVVS
jgi:hypothetical protein